MSWDFTIEHERCPKCGGGGYDNDYDDNYTYNVSPMFYAAFRLDAGIRGLNGMPCKDAALELDVAIDAMRSDPEKYMAMNPENGWGDYRGAVDLLLRLREWCRREPEARMVVT